MFISYKLGTGEILSMCLLSNITETQEIKKKILEQSIRCCCITPSLVVDPFQIVVAADKACLAQSRNKLITRNINTELLYNLSVSKHISKSLTKFGMQENDTNALIAIIGSEEDLKAEISKINGSLTNLEKLDTLVDMKAVKKEYNIAEKELEKSSLTDSVITRIATKNL
nr:EKC/KEOPS complex subunit TPRKB [Halyomorpha halys]